MNYQTIDKSELEDFNNTCISAGLDPTDFELNESDVSEIDEGNGLISHIGKVTITKDSVSRTYETGNGSHWPADFDNDIRSKVWG